MSIFLNLFPSSPSSSVGVALCFLSFIVGGSAAAGGSAAVAGSAVAAVILADPVETALVLVLGPVDACGHHRTTLRGILLRVASTVTPMMTPPFLTCGSLSVEVALVSRR